MPLIFLLLSFICCLRSAGLLTHAVLHLLLQLGVVSDGLLYDALQVGSVIEESAQFREGVGKLVHHFLHLLARDGLDAAHAGGHAALGENLHHAQLAGALGVATAAELNAVAKLHDAHLVAVLLAEEGDGAQFLGLLDGGVAMVLQGQVLSDLIVHQSLHLAQFLGCHLLEVREVEAQVFGRHERTLLFDVRAQHLSQGLVEEVRGGVVGLDGTAAGPHPRRP